MNATYSAFGLIAGVTFLIVGLVCMLGRSSGFTSIQIELWQLRCRVKTSLPGVIFAVLGLLVIYVTRPM
jgi:hypothetical protein